ncbi:hypothetical protein [Streptomyces sp. NPDC001492]
MVDLLAASTDMAHHFILAGDPPAPNPVAPPGSQKFVQVMNWIAWGVTSVCVLGVMIVAGRMAVAYRQGEGYEAMTGLGKVMAACVLLGSASAIVTALT